MTQFTIPDSMAINFPSNQVDYIYNTLMHTPTFDVLETYDFSNFNNLNHFKRFMATRGSDITLTSKSIRNFFSVKHDMAWRPGDPEAVNRWKNYQWQPLINYDPALGNAPVFTEVHSYKMILEVKDNWYEFNHNMIVGGKLVSGVVLRAQRRTSEPGLAKIEVKFNHDNPANVAAADEIKEWELNNDFGATEPREIFLHVETSFFVPEFTDHTQHNNLASDDVSTLYIRYRIQASYAEYSATRATDKGAYIFYTKKIEISPVTINTYFAISAQASGNVSNISLQMIKRFKGANYAREQTASSPSNKTFNSDNSLF